MSGDTPSIPRPPVMCLDCGERTTNKGMRCDTHRRDKARKDNKRHNADRSYYHTYEWTQLRAACVAAAYHQCVTCGSEGPGLVAHHIKARKDGGTDSLDNLACLCSPCHSRLEAGDKMTAALFAEYMRHRPNG